MTARLIFMYAFMQNAIYQRLKYNTCLNFSLTSSPRKISIRSWNNYTSQWSTNILLQLLIAFVIIKSRLHATTKPKIPPSVRNNIAHTILRLKLKLIRILIHIYLQTETQLATRKVIFALTVSAHFSPAFAKFARIDWKIQTSIRRLCNVNIYAIECDYYLANMINNV